MSKKLSILLIVSSWSSRALSIFNFGPSLIRWIQTFYKNILSTVMNNGFITAPFKVLKRVRQGEPLSPYFFIICLEILAINIRLNKEIQGILMDNEEIKLEIFADDLTVFLRNYTSLNALLETADSFTLCSGLKRGNVIGKQQTNVADANSLPRQKYHY